MMIYVLLRTIDVAGCSVIFTKAFIHPFFISLQAHMQACFSGSALGSLLHIPQEKIIIIKHEHIAC
eukprot:c32194_g1_i1 orf=52-249(-)